MGRRVRLLAITRNAHASAPCGIRKQAYGSAGLHADPMQSLEISMETIAIMVSLQKMRRPAKSHHHAIRQRRGLPEKQTEKAKIGRKKYEQELRKLQIELCKLQAWVKHTGQRIVLVFEGRDGAGKGGTIKALTERVSPRVFRVIALPSPSDREKTQMYMQRYVSCFPAAGEIVIFDRSWYNRAGVEYVMGFCTEKQHRRFLE